MVKALLGRVGPGAALCLECLLGGVRVLVDPPVFKHCLVSSEAFVGVCDLGASQTQPTRMTSTSRNRMAHANIPEHQPNDLFLVQPLGSPPLPWHPP